MQRQKLDLEKSSVCHILIIWAFNAWRPFYRMLSTANQQMIKGKFRGRDWMKISTRRLQRVLKCEEQQIPAFSDSGTSLWFGRLVTGEEGQKQRKLLRMWCTFRSLFHFCSFSFEKKKKWKIHAPRSAGGTRSTACFRAARGCFSSAASGILCTDMS